MAWVVVKIFISKTREVIFKGYTKEKEYTNEKYKHKI